MSIRSRADSRCGSHLAAGIRSTLAVWLTLLAVGLLSPLTVSPAEVHFAPDEGIRRHLLRAIRDSRQHVDVAVYQITSIELAEGLAAAKSRGVRVRVLTDHEKAAAGGAAMRLLREKGVAVRSLGVPEQSLMHNKFAIFDERRVATGSYNWTNTAERANYENLVLLDEREMVEAFIREFERLWREAKE